MTSKSEVVPTLTIRFPKGEPVSVSVQNWTPMPINTLEAAFRAARREARRKQTAGSKDAMREYYQQTLTPKTEESEETEEK